MCVCLAMRIAQMQTRNRPEKWRARRLDLFRRGQGSGIQVFPVRGRGLMSAARMCVSVDVCVLARACMPPWPRWWCVVLPGYPGPARVAWPRAPSSASDENVRGKDPHGVVWETGQCVWWFRSGGTLPVRRPCVRASHFPSERWLGLVFVQEEEA